MISAVRPTYVIIVAAGSGSRFGSSLPKQFVELCGKPVLAHTINAFVNAIPTANITVVLSEDMMPLWHDLCQKHNVPQHVTVKGGATRWESVKNAITSLTDAPDSATVLIHDGARPLTPPQVIKRVAGCAFNTDGAIPAIDVADSLRQLDENQVSSHAVDRSQFRAVQTPQAFTLWRLREAYTLPYQPDFTDDASVLAAAGFDNIVLIPGSPENIKITTPIDLHLATAIIASRANQ